MTDRDAWVPLAEIARPHGVRGEVRLKLYNQLSNVLLQQDEVLVRYPDGQEHEVSVDAARRAGDAILMKLYSVDDRDRADELRGALVCVRRADFPEPAEGEFYTVDILGAEARMAGQTLGKVIDVVEYPTVTVLVVRGADGQGDWEIPITEAYVGKLDFAARTVEVLTVDELERFSPRAPKAPKTSSGD